MQPELPIADNGITVERSPGDPMNASVKHASRRSDPRWIAIVARDTEVDGTFFYSVRTTGVYCRPSCPSRRAKRENVAFHATQADAERAGFRPCKRCMPDQLPVGRAASGEILRMTPSDTGGANTDIRFAIGECSLGSILVARSQKGVCAILMGDDPEGLALDLKHRFPRANQIGGDAEVRQLVSSVVNFVEAPRVGLDLQLDVRGTPFQRRVWQALREVPAGSTVSYTDIAKRIGVPKAVRAVAQACGANAIAVAIPCHRVVRNDGALSGYRWGIARKRALLEREAG
jgi:AraC family transcriptional regulator of adaptative response/methylated-DNA-[protein]-cysteine methyltransferase